jgi:Ca2+:H+ antiporter
MLYDETGDDVIKSIKYTPRPKRKSLFKRRHDDVSSDPQVVASSSTTAKGLAMEATSSGADLEGQTIEEQPAQSEDEEEEEIPQLSVYMTIALLAVVTVVRCQLIICTYSIPTLSQVVAVTAEWLVDSIDGMTSSGNISKEFVGIILLPIVGNAAGTRFIVYQVE